MTKDLPYPDKFLEVRVHSVDPLPGLTALCAGYESEMWRYDQLANHLVQWIPDFALTYSEQKALGHQNAVALIIQAARTVYTSPKYQKRGELGELLLHVAMRQVFKTIPAITKFFFKDSPNDTVKGFDVVHVVDTSTDLELWLGEVKFYDRISQAIRDVVAELEKHTKHDYLRKEFAAITNKIDPAWPHADRLRQLLHPNTSLDIIFDRLCIPVFLTYDSEAIASNKRVSDEFKQAFCMEVRKHHKTFSGKQLPTNCRVHLFLLPLHRKRDLVKSFDERLKQWQ